MAGDWFNDSFRSEYAKQQESMGRFNLAIFGKTGVGKSTLVNAIFGEEIARTGIGEPVTQDSHLYLGRAGNLGVIDTKGLEVGLDNKKLLGELNDMVKKSRKQDLSEQIHVAWYCVRGMDRRFEQSEAEFIRRLDELGIPVVLVLTQVPLREGRYHPDAIQLAQQIAAMELPIVGGRPYLTQAMHDAFSGHPAHGLQDLLDATFRVAPDAVKGALVAAQQIDHKRKAQEAQKHIVIAAGASAAAAASPIPFSDAAMLVPIQLGMMARIAQIYKIKFEKAAFLAIASTTAATQAGRATFTGLLKLVPGVGTAAGGAIGAGVASTYTFAIGQAWAAVCKRVAAGKVPQVNGVLDNKAVHDIFMEEFRKRLKMRQPDEPPAR
ncbi:MAG: GTP-binding DUF697 domain-containing protein [Propionibacteriales bacterium]|nr:GTP-binding DUF697 domain-containing protein [Propionibacteriales bacterium]